MKLLSLAKIKRNVLGSDLGETFVRKYENFAKFPSRFACFSRENTGFLPKCKKMLTDIAA
jgi:hypothetical protein